jgi:hypothetical protein
MESCVIFDNMRKILFLTIALFSIATCCYSEGQDTIVLNVDTSKYQVKYFSFNQDIENLPPSLLKFVPDGYTALDTASGDLNFDQYADMIMVLKKNGEDTIPDGSE